VPDETPRIYICYEPEHRAIADRLADWPVTNADRDAYDARTAAPPDDDASARFRDTLRAQIESADVLVCIIGQTACVSDWIAWELQSARTVQPPKGLVGILLHEHDVHPRDMQNCGAIFTRFKRDRVERAIAWAATERHTTDDFFLADDE